MVNPFEQLFEEIREIGRRLANLEEQGNIQSSPPSNFDDEPLVSVKKLTQHTGLHRTTIEKYYRSGLLPFYRANRSVLFKMSEVEAFLKNSGKTSALSKQKTGQQGRDLRALRQPST